jgi:hypothetical protein
MPSLAICTTVGRKTNTTAIPSNSASSLASRHFSHFFCFSRSFENYPKRTPLFSHSFFCRTTSIFAVAIVPVLVVHYLPCHASRGEDDWRQVKQQILCNRICATCRLLIPRLWTCQFSHQSLLQTGPGVPLVAGRVSTVTGLLTFLSGVTTSLSVSGQHEVSSQGSRGILLKRSLWRHAQTDTRFRINSIFLFSWKLKYHAKQIALLNIFRIAHIPITILTFWHRNLAFKF